MHRIVQRRFPTFTNQSGLARWLMEIFGNSRAHAEDASLNSTRRKKSFVSIPLGGVGRGNRAGRPVFRSRLRRRTWTDWTLSPDVTIPSTRRRGSSLLFRGLPLFALLSTLRSAASSPHAAPQVRGATESRSRLAHISFILPVCRSAYYTRLFLHPHTQLRINRGCRDNKSSLVKIECIIFVGKFCRRIPKARSLRSCIILVGKFCWRIHGKIILKQILQK